MPKTVFSKKIENSSTIAAGATWSPTESDLSEEDEILKYGFFNHLTVFNTSSSNVEVRFSGNNVAETASEFLPAGGTLIFDKDDNLRFTRPFVFNRSGEPTVAANKIILQIRKIE